MSRMSSTDSTLEPPCSIGYSLFYDGRNFYDTITLRPEPNCPTCGKPKDNYWERFYSQVITIPFNYERWKRRNENLKANYESEGKLPEADTSYGR